MIAEVNGIHLAYDDVGSGEPVVLIGGFSASRSYWNHAVSMMDGLRVITVDNRGVGDTVYEGAFTIDDLADDIAVLMDHLGIARFHAVGWSMGTLIAQSLALRHAHRIKSMTLVSGYRRRPSRSDYLMSGINDLVLQGKASPELFATVINAFCFPESFFRSFEERGRAVPMPRRFESSEGLRDQLAAVNAYDTTDVVSRIDVPTLVVHGREDIMVDPEEGAMLAGSIPGSRFLLLDSAGHNILFDLYWVSLRAFIESNA